MQDLNYTVLSILFSERGSLMDGWMHVKEAICISFLPCFLLEISPLKVFCVGSVLE